jgi:GTPase involved in cell partitioning and DNA repair
MDVLERAKLLISLLEKSQTSLIEQQQQILTLQHHLSELHEMIEDSILNNKVSLSKKAEEVSNKTKLEQAFCIYRVYEMMPKSTRLEVIQSIMDQLSMTKAGAASYYQQAKERYKTRPLPIKIYLEGRKQNTC